MHRPFQKHNLGVIIMNNNKLLYYYSSYCSSHADLWRHIYCYVTSSWSDLKTPWYSWSTWYSPRERWIPQNIFNHVFNINQSESWIYVLCLPKNNKHKYYHHLLHRINILQVCQNISNTWYWIIGKYFTYTTKIMYTTWVYFTIYPFCIPYLFSSLYLDL